MLLMFEQLPEAGSEAVKFWRHLANIAPNINLKYTVKFTN
jgi:hypothetical protein